MAQENVKIRGNTHDRLQWARSEWERDPSIPIDGNNGMIRRLYDRFGESAAGGALEVIRREARSRRRPQHVVGTNVGTKIVEAQAARPEPPQVAPPAPPPIVRTPRKKPRARPPGAFSMEQQRARLDFARGVFMQRPDISLGGADSMEQLLVQRFGCSVAPPTLQALRLEVKAELAARTMGLAPRPAPALAVVPPPEPEPPAPPVNINEVLSTIVGMALEAIPTLRSLSITVNDAGEVTAGYTVREVTVIERGGAITVPRRS